jgi:hypothetical protein
MTTTVTTTRSDLSQITEWIRTCRFSPDTLLAASISVPSGDLRDFLATLADWMPHNIDATIQDATDDFENDPDIAGDIIECNPTLVAEALEDDAWAQKVIEKLPRLNRALIKNYITALENKPKTKNNEQPQ